MIACRRVLCGSSVYVQKNLSFSFSTFVVEGFDDDSFPTTLNRPLVLPGFDLDVVRVDVDEGMISRLPFEISMAVLERDIVRRRERERVNGVRETMGRFNVTFMGLAQIYFQEPGPATNQLTHPATRPLC